MSLFKLSLGSSCRAAVVRDCHMKRYLRVVIYFEVNNNITMVNVTNRKLHTLYNYTRVYQLHKHR